MVKSKNKKSVIALVVMAFLLVASIVLAATGAWFTDHVDKEEKSLTFGTIAISSTGDTSIVATSEESDTTTSLMPGDTLKISYKIKNDGEAAYVLAYVTVSANAIEGKTLTESQAKVITALSGWYAATGESKATNCAEIAKSATESTWEHAVVLTGTDFGNDFQGAKVTVKVTIYAIQQENLTNAEAYTLLQSSIEENAKFNIDTGIVSKGN